MAAVALNVLIRVIATELAGVDARYEHLAWRDFVSTTVGVVILAVVLRVGLRRYGDRAGPIFSKIAIVIFAFSLLGPLWLFADEGADGGIVVTLALMHVATAAAVLWLLPDLRAGSGRRAT